MGVSVDMATVNLSVTLGKSRSYNRKALDALRVLLSKYGASCVKQ